MTNCNSIKINGFMRNYLLLFAVVLMTGLTLLSCSKKEEVFVKSPSPEPVLVSLGSIDDMTFTLLHNDEGVSYEDGKGIEFEFSAILSKVADNDVTVSFATSLNDEDSEAVKLSQESVTIAAGETTSDKVTVSVSDLSVFGEEDAQKTFNLAVYISETTDDTRIEVGHESLVATVTKRKKTLPEDALVSLQLLLPEGQEKLEFDLQQNADGTATGDDVTFQFKVVMDKTYKRDLEFVFGSECADIDVESIHLDPETVTVKAGETESAPVTVTVEKDAFVTNGPAKEYEVKVSLGTMPDGASVEANETSYVKAEVAMAKLVLPIVKLVQVSSDNKFNLTYPEGGDVLEGSFSYDFKAVIDKPVDKDVVIKFDPYYGPGGKQPAKDAFTFGGSPVADASLTIPANATESDVMTMTVTDLDAAFETVVNEYTYEIKLYINNDEENGSHSDARVEFDTTPLQMSVYKPLTLGEVNVKMDGEFTVPEGGFRLEHKVDGSVLYPGWNDGELRCLFRINLDRVAAKDVTVDLSVDKGSFPGSDDAIVLLHYIGTGLATEPVTSVTIPAGQVKSEAVELRITDWSSLEGIKSEAKYTFTVRGSVSSEDVNVKTDLNTLSFDVVKPGISRGEKVVLDGPFPSEFNLEHDTEGVKGAVSFTFNARLDILKTGTSASDATNVTVKYEVTASDPLLQNVLSVSPETLQIDGNFILKSGPATVRVTDLSVLENVEEAKDYTITVKITETSAGTYFDDDNTSKITVKIKKPAKSGEVSPFPVFGADFLSKSNTRTLKSGGFTESALSYTQEGNVYLVDLGVEMKTVNGIYIIDGTYVYHTITLETSLDGTGWKKMGDYGTSTAYNAIKFREPFETRYIRITMSEGSIQSSSKIYTK